MEAYDACRRRTSLSAEGPSTAGSTACQHSLPDNRVGRADEYVQRRGEAVRREIRKAGRTKATLPLVVVESSSRCSTDNGVKTLPNGTQWVSALLEQVSFWDHQCNGSWRWWGRGGAGVSSADSGNTMPISTQWVTALVQAATKLETNPELGTGVAHRSSMRAYVTTAVFSLQHFTPSAVTV